VAEEKHENAFDGEGGHDYSWLRRDYAEEECMLSTAVRPAAVLLDRDGTLVLDVPYNGDPDRRGQHALLLRVVPPQP
jgi:hypothetical protein